MSWTPTTTRLPDADETVLTWDGSDVVPRYRDFDCWRDLTGWPTTDDSVTHWMAMPAPPGDAKK